MRVHPGKRSLGKLTPRGVHFLRQTNYQLLARATHGTPSELQAYADRLRTASDELRFRIPGFSEFLDYVAGVADATILERNQRAFRNRSYAGGNVRLRTHGVARFTQRYRA